jgi:hypothetical protein
MSSFQPKKCQLGNNIINEVETADRGYFQESTIQSFSDGLHQTLSSSLQLASIDAPHIIIPRGLWTRRWTKCEMRDVCRSTS